MNLKIVLDPSDDDLETERGLSDLVNEAVKLACAEDAEDPAHKLGPPMPGR